MADRNPARPGRTPTGARSRATGARPAPRRAATRPTSRQSRARSGTERPGSAARVRRVPPTPPAPSTAWVRGAILVGIVVMLAVTLVPTMRSLVQQRDQAAALRQQVAEQQAQVADLERQAALWKNPAYIEQQARERLEFVKVGEKAYTVIGVPKGEGAQKQQQPIVAAPMANDSAPWYGKLWQSVQIADRPAAGATGRTAGDAVTDSGSGAG
ncbi:MAG: FtsB family cell division protein [Intrasporangium sp.]|uniref:FtsB family cell division protein n=1 Tax=Intrasporangium sp. TaxID=1925024 RepID=UPI003F7F0BBD